LPRWRLLELVAYINTSGGPNRREHSEHRDSDVHEAGGTTRLWGCGGNAPVVRYECMGVFWGFRTIPYGIRTVPYE
jgi:hypothetical protein